MNKGGCILINKERTKIGLVYRKKQKDYSFPKGHIEENEKIWECAIRETEEETGRKCNLVSKRTYTKMEYFTEKEGKVIVYMYYAIDAGKSEKNIKEEDKECLVWVDIDKVLDVLTYQNLKDFWNKALFKLNKFLKER